MNEILNINKLADRKEAKARKRDAKKREIAVSAINALKTYGYARTTLRDIAAHSDVSLGSLTYYFEDKDALLIYCVHQYKSGFVEEMGKTVQGLRARNDIISAYCKRLAQTIEDDAELHRLWYDIRNQAMFDETFRPVVAEIENNLIGLMRPLTDISEEQKALYTRLDGAFRYLLQQYVSGRISPKREMEVILLASVAKTTTAT